MPLYEYLCDACGHRFEVIRKFSDVPIDKCPSCGGSVHKLQSAPAIQFKGSGFYITDYPKSEHVTAAKADSGSSDAKGDAGKDKADKDAKADKTETAAKGGKADASTPAGDAGKPSSPAAVSTGSSSAKNS